jgi:hypothetical protein
MREPKIGGFSERLSAQSEARKALLAKMKPKPTIRPAIFETTAEKKARELADVRERRAAEREDARRRAEEAEAERQLAIENDEQLQLELKRQERKDRKAAAKAEARAKREAKASARRG